MVLSSRADYMHITSALRRCFLWSMKIRAGPLGLPTRVNFESDYWLFLDPLGFLKLELI